MIPATSEWVTYNKEKFEKYMKESSSTLIYQDKVVMGYEVYCLKEAAKFLKCEILFRCVDIREKYCSIKI